MFRKISLLVAALLAGASAPARADLIDFESLPAGNTSNPLTINGVTFFTSNGFNVIAALPNQVICASVTSDNFASCPLPLDVMLGQRVRDLSFDFVGNNSLTVGADVGDVAVFGGLSGQTLLGTVNLIVQDNQAFTLDTVSLAAFSQVSRLVITTDDFGGLGYDNFRFTIDVPEPATWAMMIAGFGLTGAAARRRPRMARA